jgi:cell wall assembly regulator SMI1
MRVTWERIESWLRVNAPGIFNTLLPGATDEEIRRAEDSLRVTLPESVRESYRIHNGQGLHGSASGFIEGRRLLSLEGVLMEWNAWKEVLDSGSFKALQGDPVGPVRKDWWNQKWIPLTTDGSGNHHCLDFDPAPGGKVGQIITLWHDEASRGVDADSFDEWLARVADDLERGKYAYSSKTLGLVPSEDAPYY